MHIKLIVAHKRFGKVDSVVDLSDVLAQQLIEAGVAEKATLKTAEKPEKKDKKKDK